MGIASRFMAVWVVVFLVSSAQAQQPENLAQGGCGNGLVVPARVSPEGRN